MRRLSGSQKKPAMLGKKQIFMSHHQAETGDNCHAMCAEVEARGIARGWIDTKADQVTKAAMKEGVESSDLFLLFVSPSVVKSWYTQYEISMAFQSKKRIVVVYDGEKVANPEELLSRRSRVQ